MAPKDLNQKIERNMKEMVDKLMDIHKESKQQTALLTKLCVNMSTIQCSLQPCIETCSEIICNQAKSIEDHLGGIAEEVQKVASSNSELHGNKVQEFATKRKGQMKNLWYAKKNNLSQNYGSLLQSKTKSKMYEQWVHNETFLPKKFRSHRKNMTATERESATKEGFKAMQKETDDMKANIPKFEKRIQDADNYMITKINRSEMANVAKYLTNLWKEEVSAVKTSLDTEYKEKEAWLQKLPQADETDDEEPPSHKEKAQHTSTPPKYQHTYDGRSYASVTKNTSNNKRSIAQPLMEINTNNFEDTRHNQYSRQQNKTNTVVQKPYQQRRQNLRPQEREQPRYSYQQTRNQSYDNSPQRYQQHQYRRAEYHDGQHYQPYPDNYHQDRNHQRYSTHQEENSYYPDDYYHQTCNSPHQEENPYYHDDHYHQPYETEYEQDEHHTYYHDDHYHQPYETEYEQDEHHTYYRPSQSYSFNGNPSQSRHRITNNNGHFLE